MILAHELHHRAQSLRDKELQDPNSPKQTELDKETGDEVNEEETTDHDGVVADEINKNNEDGSPEGKRSTYSDWVEHVYVNSPISNVPTISYNQTVRAVIAHQELTRAQRREQGFEKQEEKKSENEQH